MSINGLLRSSGPHPGETGSVPTRSSKLCETCKGLDLSVDRFIIDDGSFRLSKHTHTTPRDGRQQSDFSLKSGSGTHPVGRLGDLQARSETCSFCYLVVKAIENPVPSAQTTTDDPNHVPSEQADLRVLNLNATCYVNWEIDGRDNDRSPGRKARTRRLHLHWDDEALKDSYLVFVAPQRLFDFNSDSQGSWEREAFFLGRELRTDGNNQVLMKSWLDQCSQHHGESCAGGQSREFVEMADQSYFGVIDVLDMCLKSLPCQAVNPSQKDYAFPIPPGGARSRSRSRSLSPSVAEDDEVMALYEPYVALSYVWGTRKNYTTDISNIRVHQQQGSLETFLDKIPQVIRDAMDLVRRLGLRYLWVDSLCIVQNSKRSWNLNSRVMDLIYGNSLLTICAADGYDAWSGLQALNSSGSPTSQYIAECAPGVRLMVSRLAETGINSSVWNTRAWTFQERLLSKRCLIFTEGRVFFQCRSATMSEDLVSESRGAGWSLDLAKALPQILHELKRRPMRVYMNCMSRYSERKLTQPKDILAAFNGVSNLISHAMRAPFIFGLPSSHFDLALLWEPLQCVTRRVQQPGENFQDLVFPSWSWCGWKGGPMQYRSCQMEGVITNVHEWLREHTWIAWYIRDGRGNLRPIWDGKKSEVCESVEARWKGYEASFPDHEFTQFQREALLRLRKFDEDDFTKWAKEQEEAENRRGQRDLDKKPIGQRYYYDDDRGRPDPYYKKKAMQIEEYRPVHIRSVSPRQRRYNDMDNYRPNDPAGEGVDKEGNSRTLCDEYGRNISIDMAQKIRSGFQQCLPDNPFRVYIETYTSHPDKDFPDQPLLQFWTWSASLRLVQSSNQNCSLPGLSVYDIADKTGDWCGSIILDKNWVANEEKYGRRIDSSVRDFLAISDARAFTKEECDVWTYYVPKERENSEWDLYYVLLVEQRERIWYRVALGKVFKAAFENAMTRKKWKEIVLG